MLLPTWNYSPLSFGGRACLVVRLAYKKYPLTHIWVGGDLLSSQSFLKKKTRLGSGITLNRTTSEIEFVKRNSPRKCLRMAWLLFKISDYLGASSPLWTYYWLSTRPPPPSDILSANWFAVSSMMGSERFFYVHIYRTLTCLSCRYSGSAPTWMKETETETWKANQRGLSVNVIASSLAAAFPPSTVCPARLSICPILLLLDHPSVH